MKDIWHISYFFIVGALFAALPWSFLWPKVYLFPSWLGLLYASPVIKGMISGFGLVLLFTALIEAHSVFSKKEK